MFHSSLCLFYQVYLFAETAICMEAAEGKRPSLFLSVINLFIHLNHSGTLKRRLLVFFHI